MKLHLLRHSKTEPYSDSGRDFDRELLPKGKEQCLLFSEYLSKLSNVEIYCSTAKRAIETFNLTLSSKNFDAVFFDDALYLAELEDLLNFISNIKSNKDILILGHNNGLSDLCNFLCDTDIDLKTCEYVELELIIPTWNEISSAKAKIINNFYPKI